MDSRFLKVIKFVKMDPMNLMNKGRLNGLIDKETINYIYIV